MAEGSEEGHTEGCLRMPPLEAHAGERRAAAGRQWLEVPGHGPTLSGMSMHPVTAPPRAPGDGMRLEYRMHLFNPGRVEMHAVQAPTLKFQPGATRPRHAIGFAHEVPQGGMHAHPTEATWACRHVHAALPGAECRRGAAAADAQRQPAPGRREQGAFNLRPAIERRKHGGPGGGAHHR